MNPPARSGRASRSSRARSAGRPAPVPPATGGEAPEDLDGPTGASPRMNAAKLVDQAAVSMAQRVHSPARSGYAQQSHGLYNTRAAQPVGCALPPFEAYPPGCSDQNKQPHDQVRAPISGAPASGTRRIGFQFGVRQCRWYYLEQSEQPVRTVCTFLRLSDDTSFILIRTRSGLTVHAMQRYLPHRDVIVALLRCITLLPGPTSYVRGHPCIWGCDK